MNVRGPRCEQIRHEIYLPRKNASGSPQGDCLFITMSHITPVFSWAGVHVERLQQPTRPFVDFGSLAHILGRCVCKKPGPFHSGKTGFTLPVASAYPHEYQRTDNFLLLRCQVQSYFNILGLRAFTAPAGRITNSTLRWMKYTRYPGP